MSNEVVLNNSRQLKVTLDNATNAGVYPALVQKLNDLTDVTLANVADSDRLVYDPETKTWKNKDNIDGGHFT